MVMVLVALVGERLGGPDLKCVSNEWTSALVGAGKGLPHTNQISADRRNPTVRASSDESSPEFRQQLFLLRIHPGCSGSTTEDLPIRPSLLSS